MKTNRKNENRLTWHERTIAKLRRMRKWSPRIRSRGRFVRRWVWREMKRMYPFFDTDEAIVHTINFRGEKCVFRAEEGGSKETVLQRYLEHAALQAAFPDNGIIPQGILRSKITFENGRESRFKYWGMVSKFINPGDYYHHAYQEWWYAGGGKYNTFVHGEDKLSWPHWEKAGIPLAALRHEKFVQEKAKPLARKILEETGLVVSIEPRNVERVNGKPVFLEVVDVDPRKFLTYLEGNPLVQRSVGAKLQPYLHRWHGKTTMDWAQYILRANGIKYE